MSNMISVIVPIYKVEKYLNKCIESIVNQTYENLEIILVDDGSPDNCPKMCDEWATRDSRIKVIHKKNGGLSDARNVGLKLATGDYVAFVDSDDWVASDFLEILINAAIQNHAQIAASGIVKIDTQNQSFCGKRYEQKVFTPEQAIQTIMSGEGFHAVAWNKIYRKDLFEGIIYPVSKLHEDEFVTYRLMDRANRLVLCQDAIYYYWQRSGSIMSTWSENHLDALEAALGRLHLLQTKYPNLYPEDCATFCMSCVNFYRQLLSLGANKELLQKVKRYRKQASISFKQWSKLDVKQKIYVAVSRKNIGLMARILNCRGHVNE